MKASLSDDDVDFLFKFEYCIDPYMYQVAIFRKEFKIFVGLA